MIKIIGSEDLILLMNKHSAYLFNALPSSYTNCNIKNTITKNNSLKIIKNLVKSKDIIIVYCANSTCKASHEFIKNNLKGFKNVYLYSGGLYEWLLLQNYYGKDKFGTTGKCKIEKFKDYKHLPKKYYN